MSTSSGAGVNGVSRQSVLDDRIQQLELTYRNAVSEEIRNNFDHIREMVWKRIYQRQPDIVGLHEDEDSDFELDADETMSDSEVQHHLRIHRWKSLAHKMAPKELLARRRQRGNTKNSTGSSSNVRKANSTSGRGRNGPRGGRRNSNPSRERSMGNERKKGGPPMMNDHSPPTHNSSGNRAKKRRKSNKEIRQVMEMEDSDMDSLESVGIPSLVGVPTNAKRQSKTENAAVADEERLEEELDDEEDDEDDDDEGVKSEFNPYDMDHINKMIKAQREQFYKKKGWIKEEDILVTRRKKLWRDLIKKELGKTVRQRTTIRKELLLLARKAARECARVVRQRALLSQKFARESLSRGKRLAREVSAHWRQQCGANFLNGSGAGFGSAADGTGYGAVAGGGDGARVRGKRVDRTAAEQRRLDLELLEARRQQRKLNFLITQTELYAHFMARKMNSVDGSSEEVAEEILSRLEEKEPLALMSDEAKDDVYDIEAIKSQALEMSRDAIERQIQRTRALSSDVMMETREKLTPDSSARDFSENLQPGLFVGTLKHYQLKGMNWLLTLFDQGINGILADEMGLGKTIQTIAFFGSLAEIYGIWGPFLVVAPASTLHNWTQEFARFIPQFKVVPYWGNPGERKVLRRYWHQLQQQQQKEGCLVAPEDASFHVVVTSYQVVLQDTKFVSRVNWQYLVLDEAHAIKNSSSQRWNTLLKFNCRNRLLLSGTPIQNNMQELWALLHFIMPTMFDSHDEFNEWFSKDIECHVAGASDKSRRKIDENQLSRLHLILKPFMLRRVKADVENELSKKIEILIHCDMSRRQKLWYHHFKRRVSWEELREAALADGTSNSSSNAAAKSLMNIMMQMRKVCNHPDLMEKRDVRFSLVAPPLTPLRWPKLVYREFCNPLPRETFARRYGLILHPANMTDNARAAPLVHSFSLLSGHSPAHLFALSCWGPSLPILRTWLQRRHSLDDLRFICEFSNTDPSHHHSINPHHSQCLRELMGLGTSQTLSFLDWSIVSATSVRRLKCMASRIPDLVNTTAVKRVLATPVPPYCVDRNAENERFFNLALSPALMHAGPALTRCELVDFRTRIADSGKMAVLDELLKKLKAEGHRVLIYSQMTKMIDMLEELMYFNNYRYMRLDGSSRLSDRRDMVTDFQTRDDIFVFLLSTRAGGLGINLTAADTVVFYDSDWNPTVDQQAMDRAHRLGQTKQVRVYRLVCRSTVEERILRRADEKSEIHKMVISGGDFRPEVLRSGEVVSMLLDDEEMLERRRMMRSRPRKSAQGGSTTPGDGGSDVEGGAGGFDGGEGVDQNSGETAEVKESLLDRKRKAAWARSRGRGGGRPKKFRASASRDSLVLIESSKQTPPLVNPQGKTSGGSKGVSNSVSAALSPASAAAAKKRKACVVFDASGNDM